MGPQLVNDKSFQYTLYDKRHSFVTYNPLLTVFASFTSLSLIQLSEEVNVLEIM
jgi:hypothetical protein